MTLAILFFVMAVLYSAVGHAGASGYLASMALVNMAPASMKPTALLLNVVVATITTINYARAGHFRWDLFTPFAILAVPMAFLGGVITLPAALYRPLLGIVLLYSSFRLLRMKAAVAVPSIPFKRTLAVGIGALIGFFSGLTGVGGGIFLSPVIILLGWADTKRTAAVSAAFILVNSIAGLAGHLSSLHDLPDGLALWCVVVLVGGTIGSFLGSRRLDQPLLRKILAIVLVIAGLKLLL